MELKNTEKSLSNLVYLDLKEKILNNKLLPGDKLIEMDIARELGVSRTPVREALKKLEEDGLAKNFPRKSYLVSKISMKEAKNLYIVREALEPLAVGLLAEKGFSDKTKHFEEVHAKLAREMNNENLKDVQDLIIEWNIALVSSLNNDILREVMIMVNNRLYRFGNFIFRDQDNVREHYKHLEEVYDAIKIQKVEEAKKASIAMMENIYKMFESQVDYKMFRN